MNTVEGILKEYLPKLPQKLREAILSVDFRKNIEVVGKKNSLHINQVGLLENETVLVLLGLESGNDYARNIRRELQITEDRAREITKQINELIFIPVRESLQEFLKKEWEAEGNTRLRTAGGGLSSSPVQKFQKPFDQKNITPHVVPKVDTREKTTSITTAQPIIRAPIREQSTPVRTVESQGIPARTESAPAPTNVPRVEPPHPFLPPLRKDGTRIPQNFMERKLAEQVRIPAQEVILEKPPEADRKTSVDPYREPVR